MSMLRRYARLPALSLAVLALHASAADEALCLAPGVTVLEDASGDVSPNLSPVNLGLPLPFLDLVSVQVAQPPSEDGVRKLVFTITLGGAAPQLPPSAAWYVSFNGPDKKVRGVRMATDQQGVPSFFSYVASPAGLQGEGDTDGRFIEDGTEKPADAASAISGEVITIVVPAADVGARKGGDVLSGFNAAMIQAVSVDGVGGFADTFDQLPDDLLARSGAVETIENEQCTGGSKLEQVFGGALGGLLLLPLVLAGALRRKVIG